MRPATRLVALGTVGLPVVATAVTGGVSEEHVSVMGIVAGAIVGLGALGTGIRVWIVQPEIERRSAELREEIGRLRTDVVAMLHRVETTMAGYAQDMRHVQKSLDEMRSSAASPARGRSTDPPGFDPTGLRRD